MSGNSEYFEKNVLESKLCTSVYDLDGVSGGLQRSLDTWEWTDLRLCHLPCSDLAVSAKEQIITDIRSGTL